MNEEALFAKVDLAFECPDAKDIEEDETEKEGGPNGSRALSKHEAQSIMAVAIARVVKKTCQDGFTMDGPPGGHVKDPVYLDVEQFELSVHDEETLSREIDRNDAKY